jgi:hypothetical protein
MDPSEYCRQIENYLCRKNEGHLIRIVGPVFEQVCGWAAQGVPLAIAYRGIDQYCERYYAKGPRRRPVRIEFCEADILTLFDDWRRAVGVYSSSGGEEEGNRRRESLPAHLDRAIARLTVLRAGGKHSATFDRALDDTVRELDRMRAAAKSARGNERTAMLERLASMDAQLVDAARADLTEHERHEIEQDAVAELAPFSGRMSADARDAAAGRAFDRLVRAKLGLPVVTFDA